MKIKTCRGFSLVELLSVITITSILATFGVVAFSSINDSKKVAFVASDISALLETARTSAIASNTHVWVGLDVTSSLPSEMRVAVVAGKTGSASDLAGGQLRPLMKSRTFSSLGLSKDLIAPEGETRNFTDVTDSNIGNFTQQIAGSSVVFSKIIQFNPQGEASILASGSPLSPWIQIGLLPQKGAASATRNYAVIQISGASGQVRMFRP